MADDVDTGRRLEDQEGPSTPTTIMAYRMGVLEHAFKGFESQLDTKLAAYEDKMAIRLQRFEEKLEDSVVSQGQVALQDYRISKLEKWQSRLIAAFSTVATGLILLLLTQIILLATSPGQFPGSPR